MEPPGEEADEEPKLKYVRLGASVFDILQKDSATCMAVHEKFLALGTNWGVVYILDVTGNEIKRFAAHSACVNELCIEETGECTPPPPPPVSHSLLFVHVAPTRCSFMPRPLSPLHALPAIRSPLIHPPLQTSAAARTTVAW